MPDIINRNSTESEVESMPMSLDNIDVREKTEEPNTFESVGKASDFKAEDSLEKAEPSENPEASEDDGDCILGEEFESRVRDIEHRYISEDNISEGIAKIKRAMKGSERLFAKLSAYEIERMKYRMYADKYHFDINYKEAKKREKEGRRRIFRAKLAALKARVFEILDNFRYRRALRFNAESSRLENDARSAVIDRMQLRLLALLELKQEADAELAAIYAEHNKDYLYTEKNDRLIAAKIRAARRAHRRLGEIEYIAIKQSFSASDKTKLYECMNRIVDIEIDVAVMQQRGIGRLGKHERENLRANIDAKRRERKEIEDMMYLLISKSRRRTYLDGRRAVGHWILGIAILTLVIIVLVGIFHEELTEFLLEWALKVR